MAEGTIALADLRAETADSENFRKHAGFFASFLLTASCLAAASLLWGKRGGDLVVVGLGWPHVILGFLFHARKILRNEERQRAAFYWLLTLTAAISVVHSVQGIAAVIYVYFVFHAFRDEIFMYRQRVTGYSYRGRVLDRNGQMLVALLVVLAIANRVQKYLNLGILPEGQWSLHYGYEAAISCVALVLAVLAVLRVPRRLWQQMPGLRFVMLGAFLFLGAMTTLKAARWNGLLAPMFFSFLVTFHYFSWYFFTLEKTGRKPAPQAGKRAAGFDRLLQLISTRKGFLTFVILLNVLSFGGTYAYQVAEVWAPLRYAFSMDYFLYFLVFHVPMSFAPKGAVTKGLPRPAAAV